MILGGDGVTGGTFNAGVEGLRGLASNILCRKHIVSGIHFCFVFAVVVVERKTLVSINSLAKTAGAAARPFGGRHCCTSINSLSTRKAGLL